LVTGLVAKGQSHLLMLGFQLPGGRHSHDIIIGFHVAGAGHSHVLVVGFIVMDAGHSHLSDQAGRNAGDLQAQTLEAALNSVPVTHSHSFVVALNSARAIHSQRLFPPQVLSFSGPPQTAGCSCLHLFPSGTSHMPNGTAGG